MLSLLLPVALAAPTLDCGTPAAQAAVRGLALPRDPRVLVAPPNMGVAPVIPPPPDTKVPYGTPWEGAAYSENFLVSWWSMDIDPEVAERTLVILEETWTALVDEQGWPQPVSSDTYLLWVVLDWDLTSTGLTNEYTTDEYPQGYPSITLDPEWAADEAFWHTLVAHEFAHALQYRLRDYDGREGESWYWEASAQWQAELSAPDVNGHLYTAAWYSDRPEYRYDSTADSHQYGMFVFNAWLEEHETGADGLRQVWQLSEQRPGVPWDELLAESTGREPGELWGRFTGRMGNNELDESAGYQDVATLGTLSDAESGAVAYLGTHYYVVADDGVVSASSPDVEGVVLGGPGGQYGDSVEVSAGDIVGVSGLGPDGMTDYTLTLGDEAVTDDDDTGGATDPDDDDDEDSPKGTCSPVSAPLWLAWLALPLATRRRR